MTPLSSIQSNLIANPIQQAESLMLLRGREGWWGKWAWRVMVALSGLVIIWPIVQGNAPWFYYDLNSVLGVLIIIHVVTYLKVVLSTLTTGTSAVARERSGRTLELLMLTGVDHWRFVLGKWTGVMRYMMRDYVWLWVLRVGIFAWYSGHQSLYGLYRDARLQDVAVDWDTLLKVSILLLGFGFLELGFSAAIGVFVGLFRWANRAGIWIAVMLRIGVGLVLGLAVALAFGQLNVYPHRPVLTYDETAFYMTSIGSLFDNAALSSSVYLDYQMASAYRGLQGLRLGQAAGALLYIVFTLITLRLAKSVAVREGINDNAFIGKPLPKRKRDRISALQTSSAVPVAAPVVASPVFMPEDRNIFSLRDPAAVRVELYQYHRNVSRLHLRLLSDEVGVQYVQFNGVVYMDVPARWVGADFRVGTPAEYEEFLQETGVTHNSLIAHSTQLFIAETGEKPVRILAARAERIEELPNSA
ncbi:hypothetical protein G4Y79_02690 [Phototrophicus methaneseepsis]|uniref:Uncharacterized protein n=1 Tax=Phototrophicus methaneseepsis TaxID=2710758 RepID=A0A7S8EAB0_9CHLR|nr:hypothetical protein [Phototrophicus methaneseepsis]QPC83302.1 hypothetical protein G4Y79_02690 [Phototrophicus methaneseepsis]